MLVLYVCKYNSPGNKIRKIFFFKSTKYQFYIESALRKAGVKLCLYAQHWGVHHLGLAIDKVCSIQSLLTGHNQATAAVYSGS